MSEYRSRNGWSLLLLVFSICLLSSSSPSVATTPRVPLSTSGSTIVDADGKQVVLAGVNWFGFETPTHIVHGLWVRDYKSMLRQIKALGYNVIRLPFSIEAIQSPSFNSVDFGIGSNSSLTGKTPLEVMTTIIDEAGRNGLMVILDNHCLSDASTSHGLWYGVGGYDESDWIENWRVLAERFKTKSNVIGADLKNEPHEPATWGDGSVTDWRLAAERAGDAVGTIAPQWLIFVEGIGSTGADGQRFTQHWWGGNLEGVRKHPVTLKVPNKLVYSLHEYGPGVDDQDWFHTDAFRSVLYDRWKRSFQYIADDGTAPVFVGEFGGKHVDKKTREGVWQRQLMNYLSQKKYGWTYWSWNPDSSDTGGILKDNWKTVNRSKQKLLNRLIRRQAISVPK